MQISKTVRYFVAGVALLIAVLAVVVLFKLDIPRETWRRGRTIVRQYWQEPRSAAIVSSYLKSHPADGKLQIGAGNSLRDGWLNTDIEPIAGQAFLDATHRFPLPNGSMRYVSSEHVIEHISYEDGLVMLRESFRVLAPGGRVRVATPNLNRFLELFQTELTPPSQSYLTGKTAWHGWATTPDQPCYVLNRQLREWGHVFVYTPKMLRSSLELAGFRQIEEFGAGESNDAALKGIETRAEQNIAALNRYETMVFEGVRP